ncbi:MAG TPA: GDYXXLXY domain-containing protein [Polyangiales bacterium]|nr:GDYXXLXY domain-containing protein [Polyangiales bacterium]
MRRELVALAVALPVLAIGFAIVRSERQLARSNEFVFAIGGYDPRDLLKGHYLQFRLRARDLPTREACDGSNGQTCCLCLMRTGRNDPVELTRATCATATDQCDGALAERYLSTSLRYYIPELEAPSLDQQLADAMQHEAATAVLAIDGPDRVQVRELRLYGVAIAAPR